MNIEYTSDARYRGGKRERHQAVFRDIDAARVCRYHVVPDSLAGSARLGINEIHYHNKAEYEHYHDDGQRRIARRRYALRAVENILPADLKIFERYGRGE